MNTKFIWNNELDTHSQHIKNQLANATTNTRYDPHLETRIKCDASRAGLGAAVKLRLPTVWQRDAFASQIFNTNERYSVNELELMGAVRSAKYFKFYSFDKSFTVITDH